MSRYLSKPDPANPYGLTPRELAIIQELAKAGEPQSALAIRLQYSRGAINVHLWNIYRKMGVHSSAGAAVKWIREQEFPSSK